MKIWFFLLFCSLASAAPQPASKTFQIEDFELEAQGYAAIAVFSIKQNPFLNTHNTKAPLLESIADGALSSVRYLFHGRDMVGGDFKRSFHYEKKSLLRKTVSSMIALPSSLITGACLKGLSYALSPKTRAFQARAQSDPGPTIKSNAALYKAFGISHVFSTDSAPCLKLARGPFVYPNVKYDIEALRAIAKELNQHEIPFWLDDGTCLGAYRHGGVIPWDYDIDMALLKPDFDNAKTALKNLDPELYTLQDWSGALCPKTYLRVLVHKTNTLIDIYSYSIDKEKQTVCYIYALQDSPYVPKKWKDREAHLIKDISINMLFPLKKVSFDGIEAYVPGQTEAWLHEKYGENLAPARLWDAEKNEYVKDEGHPYWKQSPL